MSAIDDDQSDRARRLHQIADALGQPAEAMFTANDDIGDTAYPSAAETSALIGAFVKVTSQQARRRIISAAEVEAGKADLA